VRSASIVTGIASAHTVVRKDPHYPVTADLPGAERAGHDREPTSQPATARYGTAASAKATRCRPRLTPSAAGIPSQPIVDRLPRHPVPGGDRSVEEIVAAIGTMSGLRVDALRPVDAADDPKFATYVLGDALARARRLRALADPIEHRVGEA